VLYVQFLPTNPLHPTLDCAPQYIVQEADIRWLAVDEDAEEEEYQEGSPLLPHGLWCQRYRYADPFCVSTMVLIKLGRTTFVNTLCGKQVLKSKESDDAANAHLEEGVRIKPVTVGKRISSTLAIGTVH
jgi:hypothetical protein